MKFKYIYAVPLKTCTLVGVVVATSTISARNRLITDDGCWGRKDVKLLHYYPTREEASMKFAAL